MFSQKTDNLPARIIVTGATSQIGAFLIPRLRKAGHEVHAVTRRYPTDHPSGEGGVTWYRVDIVHDPLSLQVPGVAVLIHLAPLGAIRGLIDPLAAQGVRRIIAFSSTSRFTKTVSADQRERAWAKELADTESFLAERCARHGIPWTVFRPTLIYGCGMDKNITTIERFVRRFGFFPMVGAGTGLRQPVHADDLAAACLAVLNNPVTYDRAYNLSGGQTLTYRQMVEAIFGYLGKKPHIIGVPIAAFAFIVKVAALFPAYRHVSLEMVNRIDSDLDFDHAEAAADFGYAPRPFSMPAERHA